MKKQMAMPILLLIVLLLVFGCGDDDNNLGFAGGEEYYVIGSIELYPSAYFYASIYPVYGQGCDIDSVYFADSACGIYQGTSFNIYGMEYRYYAEYRNESDSTRFRTGDTASVRFYDDNQSLTVEIPVLLYYEDTMVYLSPEQLDTVRRAETFELVWSSVPDADWYGFLVWFAHDSSGHMTYESWNMSTTDTSIILDGNNHRQDGILSIAGIAVVGPLPGSSPNLSGLKIIGCIYSQSAGAYLDVVVGEGLPWATSSQAVTDKAVRDSLLNGLVEELYGFK